MSIDYRFSHIYILEGIVYFLFVRLFPFCCYYFKYVPVCVFVHSGRIIAEHYISYLHMLRVSTHRYLQKNKNKKNINSNNDSDKKSSCQQSLLLKFRIKRVKRRGRIVITTLVRSKSTNSYKTHNKNIDCAKRKGRRWRSRRRNKKGRTTSHISQSVYVLFNKRGTKLKGIVA